ncbi:MAG: lipocalin family protein, partial [Bacteroidales bacterium]|nr:lipocalin family protein [Bacteroidales bacterium]
MRHTLMNLAAILLICTGCNAQPKVDNSVSGDLQLDKYLGEWYEIARFDHIFERGMQYTKATYTLTE